jgi:hypothetical protein
MRKLLLPALLLAPLLQGCAAILGVGAGVLISQEMLDNSTYVARLDVGVDRLWTSAKTTLSHMSLKPIETDDDLRTAEATVDGSAVAISVEAYDLDRSILKVAAKKYGVANGEMAKLTLDKIVEDLEK